VVTTDDRGAFEGRTGGITFRAFPPAVDTPALIIDIGRVQANLARLQGELDSRGIALRPHAKTHKSVAIGRMQIDAGAKGLTVGTIGEAEVFAAAGITDLFIAYPVVPLGPKGVRLRALHDVAPSLAVGIDSVHGARRLASAWVGARRQLRVLVEVDPGLHRTGVLGAESAVEVARAAASSGLVVAGVFAHGGHSYRPGAAEETGSDEVRALTEAAEALEAAGFEVGVVSAGSTPTMLTAAHGRVNEIRAGTYSLGDRQQWVLGAIAPEGCAAVVASTVVSVFPDRVVLDAGAKALTKDRADWLEGYGLVVEYPELVIERLSDYHAVARVPESARRPKLGQTVAIVPNHVCPVVDLFDSFVALLPDGRREVWPVDARGRSQ
jgi:D-serine deaminase-like pyridoxal phosphate-dependent protein